MFTNIFSFDKLSKWIEDYKLNKYRNKLRTFLLNAISNYLSIYNYPGDFYPLETEKRTLKVAINGLHDTYRGIINIDSYKEDLDALVNSVSPKEKIAIVTIKENKERAYKSITSLFKYELDLYDLFTF